jgi:hypothetical protein
LSLPPTAIRCPAALSVRPPWRWSSEKAHHLASIADARFERSMRCMKHQKLAGRSTETRGVARLQSREPSSPWKGSMTESRACIFVAVPSLRPKPAWLARLRLLPWQIDDLLFCRMCAQESSLPKINRSCLLFKTVVAHHRSLVSHRPSHVAIYLTTLIHGIFLCHILCSLIV